MDAAAVDAAVALLVMVHGGAAAGHRGPRGRPSHAAPADRVAHGPGRPLGMTTHDGMAAGSPVELRPGDAVEAYCNGRMVHRGPIVDAVPQCGLLWILDTVTGSRHLLHMSEVEVVRLPPPAAGPGLARFLPKRHQPGRGLGMSSCCWHDASPRR